MFLVTCRHALDDGWEARDQALLSRAGRPWDLGFTDVEGASGRHQRLLVWKVLDFKGALAMRWRLELVAPGLVAVGLRER